MLLLISAFKSFVFESGVNFDEIKQLFLEVLEEEYIEKNKFYEKIYEEIKTLN